MYNIYFRDTITLITVASMDQWNTETFTETNISARVEYKTEFITNDRGEDVESQMQVYMGWVTLDKHRNKIKFEGQTYAILKIERKRSWESTNVGNHIQVWLTLSTS